MNDKEILDKMNKDENYRSDVLINFNFEMQLAQRICYTHENKFSPQEYKLAVVSLEQENARLKDNWNKLNNWLEEQVKYLTEIDGQNIPLNDNFKFCSMNELYQTGKYSGFKEALEKIEVILKEN